MDNTETKIKEAARRIFITKGMDGARMQEIADEAGINKALLHYYFRSKQKLFDAVFAEAFQTFIPKMDQTISSDKNITEVISDFVDAYYAVISENPFIPQFVINELNRDPSKLANFMSKEVGLAPIAIRAIERFKNNGVNIDSPQQFMISLVGLIIFPFVAQPILHHIIFQGDEEAVEQFFAERKSYVKKYALQMLLASTNDKPNE